MEARPTGDWLGDCLLLEPLAAGAHGEIVLARRGGEGGELVAVKRLHPSLLHRRELVTAFFDELNLCRRLVHPNIVRVYEGDVHHGQPYLVMELVDGVTLWGLVDATREAELELPPSVAVHVVTMVAEALDYAHSARDERNRPLGLVHRDVSTVNVMITFDGAVKLLDFGIARSEIREHETAPGIIRGKPQYLSPEQCSGGEIDRLTDLYSLGVVLFELLAGVRPFVEDDVHRLIDRVLRGDRPRVSDLRPEVDPELEAIVEQAMAVQRDERYQSASQMVRDLRAYAARHPEPGSTGHLASLVRALFPDRLHLVADRYGPPEETAVDQLLPEARAGSAATRLDPHHGTDFEVTVPRARLPAPPGRAEPAPGLGPAADEPTTTEILDDLASEPVAPPARIEVPEPAVPDPPPARPSPAGRSALAGPSRRRLSRRAVAALGAAAALVAAAALAATLAAGRTDEEPPPEPDAGTRPERAAVRPPDEAPTEPAAPATGLLVVEVSPSGAVVVCGEARVQAEEGRARLELPEGPHEVRVRAQGFELQRRQVEIRAGEETPLVVVLSRAWGRLTVRSRTKASVSVDGRPIGETPVRGHKLRAGTYQVTVRTEHGRRSRRVVVPDGREASVRFPL